MIDDTVSIRTIFFPVINKVLILIYMESVINKIIHYRAVFFLSSDYDVLVPFRNVCYRNIRDYFDTIIYESPGLV